MTNDFLGIGNLAYDYNQYQVPFVYEAPNNDPTPGYNHHIPNDILTPSVINTMAGQLCFNDGVPDAKTANLAYDFIDTARATSVFLDFIPMASMEAIRKGQSDLVGGNDYNKLLIFEDLMTSDSLFLTGNTETVYGSIFLDLDKDGPMVIHFPPGGGPSTINDAYFRYVTDLGSTGPDKGLGGKYFIHTKEWAQDPSNSNDLESIIEGGHYYVAQTYSYINWLIVRGYLVNGRTDAAVDMFSNHMRIYPWSSSVDSDLSRGPWILGSNLKRGKLTTYNATGSTLSTIHSNTAKFYVEVNDVIQRENVHDLIEMEQLGLLAALGIRKGETFEPNARALKIFDDGAAIGNAVARAIVFSPRDPRSQRFGPNSGWYSAFIGKSYKWWNDTEGDMGINKDARTAFFTIATVNTPAMILAIPGVGSQYGFLAVDQFGNSLDGASGYRLVLPRDIPAADFWSIVVYDTQTRSMLQTDQPMPSKNSIRDNLLVEQDGSYIIYFAPDPIVGVEQNWIRTVPGKSWFLCLRLYAPTEDWFQDKWIPGELELLGNRKMVTWLVENGL